VLATLLLAARPVRGVCPDDLCDCLPSAGAFNIVASGALKAQTGKYSVAGSPYIVEAILTNDACATTGKVQGRNDAPTQTSNLTFLAPLGDTAVKFRTKVIYGYTGLGVEVTGDVATGGGAVAGQSFAMISGVVDTSGSHSSIAPCQQALIDLPSASALLGALTPTQTLGDVVVKGGTAAPFQITAGPGVNVISATKIAVAAKSGGTSPDPSSLIIQTDPGTTAVVINTLKLTVGKTCDISLADPADASKVIINVTGSGGRVSVGREARIEVPVLSAQRKITLGQQGEATNLFGLSVTVKGGTVDDALACGG
jgi:hypothetical protein